MDRLITKALPYWFAWNTDEAPLEVVQLSMKWLEDPRNWLFTPKPAPAPEK